MRTTKRRTRKGATRRIGIFFGIALALFLVSRSAFAHPMGNFSVNHYGKIKVGQSSVEILYLVDMAEIPTYQEMRQFPITTTPDDPGDMHYLDGQSTRLKEGLTLEIDGQNVGLDTVSRQMTFAGGAGGLPTMKLSFVFRGKFAASGAHKLSYADNNYPGHAGWKEIVVIGDGSTILGSTAPDVDRSQELTDYSTDLLNSPPQQLAALVNFKTAVTELEMGSSVASANIPKKLAPLPPATRRALPARESQRSATPASADSNGKRSNGNRSNPIEWSRDAPSFVSAGSLRSAPLARNKPQNTPRSRFTELISTQGKLGFWVLLSAALIAAGLGALHALEPGHGKTIVAAYLVGSRGTARHAVLLGFVVTAAHTAGVYLLGIVTLYASRYIVPEQLYPWLGAISGLSVTGLGVFIFLRHWSGENGEHTHTAGEQHSHWFLSVLKLKTLKRGTLKEAKPQSSIQNQEPLSSETGQGERCGVSLRELCVLGVTGGIVPCPAALVVLLSAFSLHRIGFGLFLITAFSLGLAGVLVVVGLTMVYTKRFMARRVRGEGSIVRYLPLLSSAFMMVLGVGIAASAFASAPIGQNFLAKDKLVPFVTITLLGLFLGMRHSTDPDHVVAVSTIVSRQQSIKSSAAIGLLWGLGHTLTIFLVGSAIIIFGVVIPPRLGLSMEFCVALMLILLGILNLTGLLEWITARFTPAETATGAVPGVSSGNADAESNGRPGAVVGCENKEIFLGRTIGKLGVYQTLRPLVVGLVHGLAGSAAVALLVLSTIKNPFWSTAYLLVFGLGTMAGMMLMTAAISVPLVFTGRKFFRINRHLTAISGLASVAFGMFLVYHIGFVDGLFSSHVHWIPQ
jgi:ABC-type nickel/cobalt efflux system permease component RcnA